MPPDDPPLLAVPVDLGSFVVDGGAVLALGCPMAVAIVAEGAAVVVVDADPSPVLLDVTP